MKWVLNLKVHSKLLLVYLCTSFLPMSILLLVFYGQMADILVEREIGNLHTVVGQASESLNTELQLYSRMSEYIAFNQTIAAIINSKEPNSFESYQRIVKEFDPMIDSFMYSFYPSITQATVYAGNEIVPHGSYLRPLTEAPEADWEAVSDGKIHWYADAGEKSLYFVRNMPLLEKTGGGMFCVALDYEVLFEYLDLSVDYEYDLFVYNENGTMLYTKNSAGKEAVLSYQDFLKEKENTDSAYVILQEQVSQNDWHIGCVMKRDWFVSPMQPMLLLILLVWGICMVASLAVILFFSRNISGRIGKLNGMMKKVEQGNLEVEIQDTQMDEIGDLSKGFNHMVTELHRLIEEVYESKIRQKKYEMTALRAQINPHFLYNTLSLINWKALEVGEDDISKVTLALSRYYRTSLNKGKNTMSIREEIDNVKAYLEIQDMMHDHSFQIVIDVPEELLELETLNLILQPLAENAIAHGIDQKRQGEGILCITGCLEENEVVLKVSDNGIGMEKEKAESILSSKSSGYGVRNVNSRIKLQYGEEYGLTINSIEGVGTEVTVRFPVVERVR